MQSSHVFTNPTGDIPVGAEMFEAQVKRLKSLSSCGPHTHALQQESTFIFRLCA